VAQLRQELAPFASQQFREIWVSVDAGGPSLAALMNTDVGWLMYLRHDDGDPGFSSRNPMYDETGATLGGLAHGGLFNREHVPVIAYRLSNGQEDEYPARWALPESDVMRALEYFVEHEGRRPPFVQWHDDGERTAVAEPLPEITQPKGEFTVVLQAVGEKKIEVIREIRVLTRLGLKEAKDLVEGAPKNIKEGAPKDEAEKIKATLEKVGATVELKCS
jgi:ribosomal protein L7/L12